jgi:hypothetical protein
MQHTVLSLQVFGTLCRAQTCPHGSSRCLCHGIVSSCCIPQVSLYSLERRLFCFLQASLCHNRDHVFFGINPWNVCVVTVVLNGLQPCSKISNRPPVLPILREIISGISHKRSISSSFLTIMQICHSMRSCATNLKFSWGLEARALSLEII